jgi:hypothetical protein
VEKWRKKSDGRLGSYQAFLYRKPVPDRYPFLRDHDTFQARLVVLTNKNFYRALDKKKTRQHAWQGDRDNCK